jgi:hypothetical protein
MHSFMTLYMGVFYAYPYMWGLLGTKAVPCFLIQNRFWKEWGSSRPVPKGALLLTPDGWAPARQGIKERGTPSDNN